MPGTVFKGCRHFISHTGRSEGQGGLLPVDTVLVRYTGTSLWQDDQPVQRANPGKKCPPGRKGVQLHGRGTCRFLPFIILPWMPGAGGSTDEK